MGCLDGCLFVEWEGGRGGGFRGGLGSEGSYRNYITESGTD